MPPVPPEVIFLVWREIHVFSRGSAECLAGIYQSIGPEAFPGGPGNGLEGGLVGPDGLDVHQYIVCILDLVSVQEKISQLPDLGILYSIDSYGPGWNHAYDQ